MIDLHAWDEIHLAIKHVPYTDSLGRAVLNGFLCSDVRECPDETTT